MVSSSTSPSVAATLNLETNETIKRLLDRISVLEGMVSGLLETQKSSIWFPQGLRPTPSGIEVVSRRESVGAESDIGTVLSQLVRPSGPSNQNNVRTVTIAPLSPDLVAASSRLATGPEPYATEEVEEEQAEAEEEQVEAEAEEEQVEAEAEDEQVEAEEQVEVEEAEEQAEEEEQVETEEAEEQAEEAEEQAEEAEEAEEEQVVEYKEIEWKGQSYWVDDNQQVYEMDSDGDLVETPIGVWKEATQKLVRYKSP